MDEGKAQPTGPRRPPSYSPYQRDPGYLSRVIGTLTRVICSTFVLGSTGGDNDGGQLHGDFKDCAGRAIRHRPVTVAAALREKCLKNRAFPAESRIKNII